MKEIFKMGLSQFGKLIIINVMSFFLVISMSVLATAAFTENIGYKAYGTLEGSSESVELYEHYYDDGDDTKRAEFEEQGYTVTESKIRSEVSKSGNAVFLSVTQLICFLLLVLFIYPNLWERGTKDSNLVHFKHQKEDKLKGLKCGIVSVIPVTALYLFIIATKSTLCAKLPTGLFNFLNPVNYSLNTLLCKGAATLGELSVFKLILMLLLNLLVIIVSYLAYLLGYKNISLGEKFIYKKNKA